MFPYEASSSSDDDSSDYVPPKPMKKQRRNTRKKIVPPKEKYKQEKKNGNKVVEEKNENIETPSENKNDNEESDFELASDQEINQNAQVPQDLPLPILVQTEEKSLIPLEMLPLDSFIPSRQIWKYVSANIKLTRLPALRVHEVMYFKQYYEKTGLIPQLIKDLIHQKDEHKLLPWRLTFLLHNLLHDLENCDQQFDYIKNGGRYYADDDFQRQKYNAYCEEVFKKKFNFWNTYFNDRVHDEYIPAQNWHRALIASRPSEKWLMSNYLEILYTKLPKGLRLQIPRYATQPIRFLE